MTLRQVVQDCSVSTSLLTSFLFGFGDLPQRHVIRSRSLASLVVQLHKREEKKKN